MKSRRRQRMHIEVVVAILFALFAVMTIMDPQWIELLFEFDPDRGSGEAEWGITVAFGVASLVASLRAGRDRRLLTTESTR